MSLSKIPIENIYYLLCYAWDKLDEADVVSVDKLNNKNILELLSRVLISGMGSLIRRGLDRDYIEVHEESRSLRGKIDFSTTIRKNLLQNAKIACTYDDLSYNVLHNQIIKSTIRSLIRCNDINKSLIKQLVVIYRKLVGIDEIRVTRKVFKNVRLNRNNYYYDFLLKVCELINDKLIITDKEGNTKFRDFLRDERAMNGLFEAFVRNFYKKELKGQYDVSRMNIPWNAVAKDENSQNYLPNMQTDIYLESKNDRLIIDTKYYKDALQTYYDKKTIHSNNLYQIYSYLKNYEALSEKNVDCRGMLLYPTTSEELSLNYEIDGHEVSIKTINLNQHWEEIDKSLKQIVI